VETCRRAGQDTDYNIIRRMRFSCWITKAIDTHSEYVILIVFQGNNGYTNARQCYVIRTLPVLFTLQPRLHTVTTSLKKDSGRTASRLTTNITACMQAWLSRDKN